jgi:hypothetical protein
MLIPVPKRVLNFGEPFAIGRVLSVAAPGVAQAHPSFRWDGLPGRRSHTRTTQWALGITPTVRIGVGAWCKLANTRQSGDTDQARTQIHDANKGTQEQKGKRAEAFNKGTPGVNHRPGPGHLLIEAAPPLARATALHFVALRAFSVDERKNLAD